MVCGSLFTARIISNISSNEINSLDYDLSSIDWSYFKLADVFNYVSRGKRLTAQDREVGDVLYFSASELNNGWTDSIGNPIFIEKMP